MASGSNDGKHALVELHKDWKDMSAEEREAFLRTATEAIYGKGTYVPKAQRGGASGGQSS